MFSPAGRCGVGAGIGARAGTGATVGRGAACCGGTVMRGGSGAGTAATLPLLDGIEDARSDVSSNRKIKVMWPDTVSREDDCGDFSSSICAVSIHFLVRFRHDVSDGRCVRSVWVLIEIWPAPSWMATWPRKPEPAVLLYLRSSKTWTETRLVGFTVLRMTRQSRQASANIDKKGKKKREKKCVQGKLFAPVGRESALLRLGARRLAVVDGHERERVRQSEEIPLDEAIAAEDWAGKRRQKKENIFELNKKEKTYP